MPGNTAARGVTRRRCSSPSTSVFLTLRVATQKQGYLKQSRTRFKNGFSSTGHKRALPLAGSTRGRQQRGLESGRETGPRLQDASRTLRVLLPQAWVLGRSLARGSQQVGGAWARGGHARPGASRGPSCRPPTCTHARAPRGVPGAVVASACEWMQPRSMPGLVVALAARHAGNRSPLRG